MSEINLTVITKKSVPVKYLHADCGVRYWDDVEDTDGALIPCRDGDSWCPVIDIETGKIEGWPEGTVARIHYKVCDAGIYTLLNANREKVASVSGYVISMMCPGRNRSGNYILMNIDESGRIANWEVDLSEFEGESEE